MKTLIKLSNEYASNLKVLLFGFDAITRSYYDMFTLMFKDCVVSSNKNIAKTKLKNIDIAFIRINNNSKFDDQHELEKFMHSLRIDNELLPIYLIKDYKTELDVVSCYCSDGYFPTPYDRAKAYRILYRVLKRVVTIKDMQDYIEILENQLPPVRVKAKEKKQIQEIKPRDKNREKDIRFSQTEKISALEFMNMLDDTIFDKIEELEVELNSLIDTIYNLENLDAASIIIVLIGDVEPIINNIFALVDSMGYFPVTARAFNSFRVFLSTLSEENFENEDNKSLFITMLLAIINDLEKWLRVIFIDHSTDDIHYLDASFSSNILEIENIFLVDDDDDDDLEFF